MSLTDKSIIPSKSSRYKQTGAALLVMVFILGLGVAAYMLKAVNANTAQLNQQERSRLILAEAKAALIGYTLSRTDASERPGDMPRPDYFASSESPRNYDGEADGGCLNSASANGLPLVSSGANMRCLGRLPWRTIRMSMPSPSESDVLGVMPWYAVSANLTDPACMSTINSGMLSMPYTTYVCGSLTNLPHPWLTVRDSLGNIISNRVAAVIMLPSTPINGQTRSDSPLNGVTSYLDSENSDFDNEFLASSGDITVNDRLVYITIDELITALEKRVGEMVRARLKKYQDTNGYYPYATQLGTVFNFSGEQGLLSGHLPVDYQSCTYTRTSNTANSLSCLQPVFDINNTDDPDTSGIASISFTGTTVSFTSRTGSCNNAGLVCTCTGNGSCSGGLIQRITFTCADTICSTVTSSLIPFLLPAPSANGAYLMSGGKFNASSGGCVQSNAPTKDANGCSNSNSIIACSSTLNGTFSSNSDVRFDTVLPAWFEENMWQNYVYYQLIRPASNDLTAGSKTSDALIVTVGVAITDPTVSKGSAQIRNNPTTQCSQLNEYMDSDENVSANSTYEASSKQKARNYNDQIFLVQP